MGVLAAVGALYLRPARAAVGPLPGFGLALPAETRCLIGFDARRLTASPLYARFAKHRAQARPHVFRELEEKTGLDPERDLDRVLIAGLGNGKESGVVLAQGRFDRTKLARGLETEGRQGLTWKSHGGTTVYLFNESASKPGALAFLSDDTLLIGTQVAVETTLDNHAQGREALRENVGLMTLVEKLKPGSAFWMVGDQSLLAQLPRSLPAPAAKRDRTDGGSVSLPALKSLIVTGELDPQLALEIVGEASDAAAARNLADLARGFVALLSLQANQRPELKELAAAFSVATEANQVRLSARIPHEVLEALHPKRAASAPPAATK
jgi:hypothetical protein